MTRFWIGMERAIDLVLMALKYGRGGDVFVPKLPACRVDTLASAIAPDSPVEVVGIRPGEKIHEVLITPDEARNVREFDQHFVITPPDASRPLDDESAGRDVGAEFRYSSDVTHQLTVSEVQSMLRRIGFLD
jgi:UDP-N-acetylglucosamine 4,6-dehydratase/5-epimerase